jgi:3-oxoacyl-[acyl-carrier protein] reductase
LYRIKIRISTPTDRNCVKRKMQMTINDQPLAAKVAVITGAGRGIGRAIALAYAAAGAAVVCAARTVLEIEATVEAVTDQGGRGLAIPTDVTQQAAVEQLFRQSAEHFGGIDIVVINAGINPDRRTVAESDPVAWPPTIAPKQPCPISSRAGRVKSF